MLLHLNLNIFFSFLLNCNINKNQVVIFFTASWCGPCKFITPLFHEMAAKYPNADYVNIDVEELSVIFSSIFSLFFIQSNYFC